jgi:hypothetical protein
VQARGRHTQISLQKIGLKLSEEYDKLS